jgi:hypothetical protein
MKDTQINLMLEEFKSIISNHNYNLGIRLFSNLVSLQAHIKLLQKSVYAKDQIKLVMSGHLLLFHYIILFFTDAHWYKTSLNHRL